MFTPAFETRRLELVLQLELDSELCFGLGLILELRYGSSLGLDLAYRVRFSIWIRSRSMVM